MNSEKTLTHDAAARAEAVHASFCLAHLLDREVWYDLAPALTCTEADTFERFLRSWGNDEVADALAHHHAETDEEGDAHYLTTPPSDATAATE